VQYEQEKDVIWNGRAIVEKNGCEIWDVGISRKPHVVSQAVYRQGCGVSIEDCERRSAGNDPVLDEKDPSAKAMFL
jgi:ribosome maturation factor RimP